MATLLNKFKQQKREAENSLPSFDNGGKTADWTKLSVKDRERFILNYLKNETSWSPQVILGIVGNMKRETPNLDLGYKAGSKNTIGLAHWEGERKDKLLAKGNVSNPITQLKFLIEEIETGTGFNGGKKDRDKFLASKDVKEATFAFTDLYERPSKPAYSSRLSYANELAKNHSDIIKPAIYKTDTNSDGKWKWDRKGSHVYVEGLDKNIIAYLNTLEPEYQKMILATAGSDGKHTKNSRHYSNKAVDLRFNQQLYDRVMKDPKRKEFGITLLDPNHGTAPHLHLSVGNGSESKKDVYFSDIKYNPISEGSSEYDPTYEKAVYGQYENMAKAYSILAGAQVSAEDIEKRIKAENGLAGIQAELMMMEKAKEHQKEVAEANKLAEEALAKEQQEKANKEAQEQQAVISAMEQQQKEREFHANAYLGTMKQDVKIDPAVFSSSGGEQQPFRFGTQMNLQNAQLGGVIKKIYDYVNPVPKIHEDSKKSLKQGDDFVRGMIQSPRYREMLSNYIDKEDLDNEIKQRLSNLDEDFTHWNEKYLDKINASAFYEPNTGRIVYKTEDLKDGSLREGLVVHEKAHQIDEGTRRIPAKTLAKWMGNINKKHLGNALDMAKDFYEEKDIFETRAIPDERLDYNGSMLFTDYSGSVAEQTARAMELRHLLKKHNIYDPYKEKFTEEHLENLYDYSSGAFKDLEKFEHLVAPLDLEKFNDDSDEVDIFAPKSIEKILWFINNVAKNEDENKLKNYAQKGGVIQQAFEKPNLLKFKNKYLNKYQVGGLINSTNLTQGDTSKEIEEEYELKENTPEIYKEFPIYKTAEDFYKKNKDLKTYKPSYENGKLKYKVENLYVGEGGAYSLNRIKENISDEGGNVLVYKDQCLSSACRAIDGLHSSGASYTQSSDETKKLLGFGSSTNSAPTEEEKLQRPEFIDDDNFGSVDSWDLAFVANKNSPKNVLFDATKGQRELDVKDFEDSMISFNDAMKKYKIPFGSFITLGTRYKSDDSTKALGAVHTVRVTGYLEDGEPIVSDSETVKPLSEAFRIWGDKEGKTIASIITVPGKEKYTFDYFKNAINKSKTKSNEKYVDYNSKMPLVNDEGVIEYVKPSKDYKKYAKVISENKNYITSLLDISDEEYDKYAKIALSIPALETQYGKGMMYGISRIDRDIFDGDSKGVSQLVGENVKPKYEKILSKYKDGTPENDALSTILYLKELDGYSKQWMEDSFFETERPYKLQENSVEGLLKDAVRPIQGRAKSGFYSNKTSGYTFKVDDVNVDIDSMNKLRGETEEEYINRINKEIKDKGLRLDMEDRGGKRKPVIYKKTYGNSIPNDLSHTVGYLWQSPNAIRYGDAQGQSKYYKNFRKVYEELFEKNN